MNDILIFSKTKEGLKPPNKFNCFLDLEISIKDSSEATRMWLDP